MDTSGGNSLPSPSCPDGKKREVCYYHDAGIAIVDYGEHHNMVPRRVDMAHALVRSYGLLPHMRRLRTRPATVAEIGDFHAPDYVRLLQSLTPESFAAGGEATSAAQAHNIGVLKNDGDGTCWYDNPPIAGLWDYCRRYAGGSLAAARALAAGDADIAVNWSGGMHHACSAAASGFCFVNDIVLAVRALLAGGRFRRVLYVDIDVHHGDGVETAFLGSGRVMTVSFHQSTRDFFPEGRGHVGHVGEGDGLYRALNVPLMEGMGDDGYCELFRTVMTRVVAAFQPDAVVMQCGADSLSGDRLGRLNLSVAGHAQCVAYMRSFNLPLLLLGGGGYTVNHVAACWCYETAVAIGKEIDDDIPMHCYDDYYSGQGHKLHYPVDKGRENKNSKTYLQRTMSAVMRNLSHLEAAPSVQFKDPLAGPGGESGASIDTEPLFYAEAPREDDDPMERLHRLCGEREVRRFLMELGKKRQVAEARENGGGRHHRTSRPEPVKKHRHDKLYFKC